jgi:AcrR family transcriptional regulator
LPVSGEDREEAGEHPELGPLPGGHHGLSPEQVADSQRERLLAATAEVVAERGYRATTITEIVKAASVSSKAFYQHFDSKEECFLAAFDAVIAHLEDILAAAISSQEEWAQRVIAALRAALAFFASEPALARLCLVEPITATPTIIARFRAVIVAAIPFLETGRGQRADAQPLPESTEDSLLGGLVTITSRAILTGVEPLQGLLPDLVDFVLAPYLGPAEAKKLAAAAAAETLS